MLQVRSILIKSYVCYDCLETFVKVKNKIDHIDSRVSVNDVEPRSCAPYLEIMIKYFLEF